MLKSSPVQCWVAGGAALAAAAMAPAAFAVEYATVVSSTPVTASVPVRRQVCADAEQVVQQAPSGAGAVLGAIAGGVLGNSVGGGFGRAAATGAGVVAGSMIGNQVEANSTPATAVPVRRCQLQTTREERVVGYDVMYDYAGQRYSTRMARDPGQRFAVSVQPADASGSALPAPATAGAVPPAVYSDAGAASSSQPVYDQPYYPSYYPSYYQPAPAYYYAPSPYVYVGPSISLGFGYYGGRRGGRHWR
ncbi:MAG TPA: glycine zipper 2TM domain-containing protein [Burkholderiaceae bacterium]|nr:glycine zipper 2TM domain-containing protein [Burkholderiaceae bacterium]